MDYLDEGGTWFTLVFSMLSVGQTAPNFDLTSLDGASGSLRDWTSRGPVLVGFYKVSCPVCQMTFPFLDRMKDGGLQMVAISQDGAEATRKFNEKFGVSLPTLLDSDAAGYPASNAFGITHVPSLFLVEPDGVISLASEGFVKADLEAIGQRAAIPPFRQDDNVPAWKAG